MYKRSLVKPDGRSLHLYSGRPIPEGIVPVSPMHGDLSPNPHMRWHPWRREWVAYASHRQDRTFLPPRDYSPLAVTRKESFPTEMPAGEYEVAVFDNLFPSLTLDASSSPDLIVPTRPGNGACEVVVFTQDPDSSLSRLELSHFQTVLRVFADRSREMGKRLPYVMPFENRGVEMGVTLHHPHGQIYGYSAVPPVPALMLASMQDHFLEFGRGLFEKLIDDERRDGRRIVHDTGDSLSFVPVCARYPYECWVAPSRPASWLAELSDAEFESLAIALRQTLRKLDGLWARPQPYLMVLYQAPFDGHAHPEFHLHFEIYPPYRTRERLKFLAGTELGAGLFVNDSLPEEKAAELRGVAT